MKQKYYYTRYPVNGEGRGATALNVVVTLVSLLTFAAGQFVHSDLLGLSQVWELCGYAYLFLLAPAAMALAVYAIVRCRKTGAPRLRGIVNFIILLISLGVYICNFAVPGVYIWG